MAKRSRSVDAKLDALDALSDGDPISRAKALGGALKDAHPVVVRKAARMAENHLHYELETN